MFLKTERGTVVLPVEPCSTVAALKQTIERLEGIDVEDQLLFFGGKPLDDSDCSLDAFGIGESSTVHFSLRLLGGGKKRKKKVYTTPKKVKGKRKKVKLPVLKYYKVSDDGTIERLRVECTSSSCGGGVFMAKHKDRHYCGKCHSTLVEKS